MREKVVHSLPRLPLEGIIDLTYRCNNNCLHCWSRIEATPAAIKAELSFDEIVRIAGEARNLGCRKWTISGGEPMLRPDFADIFDCLTRRSAGYILNTNGTLITPAIARLLKRKGIKLVALYGADAAVHDAVSRRPGSFAAAMRGIAYLQEAGAAFITQIVPMKANFHQYGQMVRLAESLGPFWRLGASWLYLSASGQEERNREIAGQRLSAAETIDIEGHDLSYSNWGEEAEAPKPCAGSGGERLFASCIAGRRDFHVDANGRMTFCELIQDPALRYDLKRGSVRECWEKFIPSLAGRIRGGEEYRRGCGACTLRPDCRWCPTYGFLEHRRFEAKVDHLCAIAAANRQAKESWKKTHRRYYQIAGLTLQVEADIPMQPETFLPVFREFAAAVPGDEIVYIRHHFHLPRLAGRDLGERVYQKAPWSIYRRGQAWIYLEIPGGREAEKTERAVVCNRDHSRFQIYHYDDANFRRGNLNSLTALATDQILIARTFAEKQACYLHASGLRFVGKGLLFVGHAEAGKSTIAKMVRAAGGELLCDDRMVVRKWPEGYRIHGTWSHGELPQVSAGEAPLRALFFLEKSSQNKLLRLCNRGEIFKVLLACLIKPLATEEWWDKVTALLADIARSVPAYTMRFDKSGAVVELLREL